MAIAEAHEGRTPFGAVVVRGGQVLARSFNTVRQQHDPTAHAEVNAIREACSNVKSSRLDGASLYTTCEPCPMCAAAAFFAGITDIYYGADIPTISLYLPQIDLRTRDVLERTDRAIRVTQVKDDGDYVQLLEQYG